MQVVYRLTTNLYYASLLHYLLVLYYYYYYSLAQQLVFDWCRRVSFRENDVGIDKEVKSDCSTIAPLVHIMPIY